MFLPLLDDVDSPVEVGIALNVLQKLSEAHCRALKKVLMCDVLKINFRLSEATPQLNFLKVKRFFRTKGKICCLGYSVQDPNTIQKDYLFSKNFISNIK